MRENNLYIMYANMRKQSTHNVCKCEKRVFRKVAIGWPTQLAGLYSISASKPNAIGKHSTVQRFSRVIALVKIDPVREYQNTLRKNLPILQVAFAL